MYLKDIKALSTGGTLRRFIVVFIFIFLIDNPTPISIVEFLNADSPSYALKVTVAVVTGTILIMLCRNTWTALRLLNEIAVIALMLALASLLWYLREWITLNDATRYFTRLLVITTILTFGQTLPFYVRQLSDISPVLKYPP